MAIGRIAGPGSIAVSLILIATVVIAIILAAMDRGAKRPTPTPRKTVVAAVMPPAPKAPPVAKSIDDAPAYPVGHIRLPPPPAKPAANPPSTKPRTVKALKAPAATKPAPAPLMITPLRPSKAKSKPKSKPKPVRKLPPRMALRVRKTPPPPLAKPKPHPPKPKTQPPKPQPITPAATEITAPAPMTNRSDGAKIRKAGRVLLKLREHGKGPTVEIAWPDSGAARRRLYHRLVRCYGMRAAVFDGQDRLFAATGAAGSPWNIDLDRFSGFLRSPVGQPIPEESRVFAGLAARHNLKNWRPVRIFPRNVDAVLLGGLQHIVGGRYASARSITAAYITKGSRLILGSVRVDSRAMAGAVDLTGAAKFTCRRRAGG